MKFILFFHFYSYLCGNTLQMDTVDNVLKIGNKNKSDQRKLAEKAREILKNGGEAALEKFITEASAKRQNDGTGDDIPEILHNSLEDAQPDNQFENSAPEVVSPSPATTRVPDILSTGDAGTLAENIEKAINKAPVDKSKMPSTRPTTYRDTLMILYPKSAAFGRYNMTELADNILTIISRNLQGYMSHSLTKLKPDILGEISLRVDTNELVGDDKGTFLKEVDRMMTHKFTFWWRGDRIPNGTKNVETTGVIISTMHNYVGTSYVDLVVNKWALPFLLYYGKGNGANLVNWKTSLSLPGKYTKRIHKILSGYVDAGTYEYSIEKFRYEFEIPAGYTNATIKRDIITPAIKNINKFEEDFNVSAEFKKLNASTPGKTKDTIVFKIKPTEPRAEPTSAQEQREYVLQHLPLFLSELYSSNLWKFVQTWQNHGDLGFVYAKIKYYTEQVAAGNMTPNKAKNFLIKALEEETHVRLHTSKKKKIIEN